MAEYICIAVQRICGGARGTHYPRVEDISIFRGSSPLPCPRLLSNPHPFPSPFFPRRKVNVQGRMVTRERRIRKIENYLLASHFLYICLEIRRSEEEGYHVHQLGQAFHRHPFHSNLKISSYLESRIQYWSWTRKQNFSKNKIPPQKSSSFNYDSTLPGIRRTRIANKICIRAGMRGIKGETSDK